MPPSDPPSAPAIRRRRWSWRWFFALAALFIGVPAIYVAYQATMARRALEQMIAELDAADPGWRLDEIEERRAKLPDEQNSALLIRKLSGQVMQSAMNSASSALEDLPAQAVLNPEQRKLLRDALTPMAQLRKEALRLKDLPQGRYPMAFAADFISTNLTDRQNSREIMHLLQLESILRAEDEDGAGAMQICQALLNTARALGDEPLLISQLIRFAGEGLTLAAVERTLAQAEVPEDELRRMQELLELEAQEPLLTVAIRGERGGAERVYRGLGDRTISASRLTGGGSSSWGQTILDMVPLPLGRNHEAHLRYMTQMVEISKLPVAQQRARMEEIEKTVPSMPVLVRLLVPAVSKVAEAYARTRAYLHGTAIAVAAERYRLQHKQWPASLDDLVAAKLLSKVPTDPYDGQPMRWRLLPDGAVAYSVGFDRADSNGTLDRNNPRAANTDYGIRLWNVAARRQPPAPPKGTP